MTIKNRKGQVAGAEEVPVPVKKRGRPKKTEVVKNKINPALPIGAFHQMFPVMLKYAEDKTTKTCYFQCEEHLEKHIMRHKLDRLKLTIGQTEPRTH
ncbi:hypothetical protein EB001_05080 [bacterium]|nr:hypothetical protein [bacterium]